MPDELLSISVKHDLTPDEREREKKLRQDVKIQNASNPEKNSKFVVWGPPWERTVCKLEKRGDRWVPARNANQNPQTPELGENGTRTAEPAPRPSL